jgi:hypothetical protein
VDLEIGAAVAEQWPHADLQTSVSTSRASPGTGAGSPWTVVPLSEVLAARGLPGVAAARCLRSPGAGPQDAAGVRAASGRADRARGRAAAAPAGRRASPRLPRPGLRHGWRRPAPDNLRHRPGRPRLLGFSRPGSGPSGGPPLFAGPVPGRRRLPQYCPRCFTVGVALSATTLHMGPGYVCAGCCTAHGRRLPEAGPMPVKAPAGDALRAAGGQGARRRRSRGRASTDPPRRGSRAQGGRRGVRAASGGRDQPVPLSSKRDRAAGSAGFGGESHRHTVRADVSDSPSRSRDNRSTDARRFCADTLPSTEVSAVSAPRPRTCVRTQPSGRTVSEPVACQGPT